MQTNSLQYGIPAISWDEIIPWIIVGGIILTVGLILWLLMQPGAKRQGYQEQNSGPYYGSASPPYDDDSTASSSNGDGGSDAGGSSDGGGSS